ncbi:MAG: PAS domain S-box protein [Actinomycetota bacterium]|nr:PAS domain S-box protein [Actinomycetota bacterium]
MNEGRNEEQIMKELDELRSRVAELESLESDRMRIAAEPSFHEGDKDYFQALVENSRDVVIVLDADKTIRYVSPSAERIIGYKPEEITAGNPLGLVHPDDRARVMETITEGAGAQGSPVELEYRIRHKDGSWRNLEAMGISLLEEAPVFGIVVSIRDITDYRKMEEELRESEERYRKLIENLNDAVFNVDVSGVITYISPAIERMSGLKVEEIQGRPFADFVYPEDLPGLVESFQRTVAGHLEPYEFRVVDTDGSILFVETSSRPIRKGGAVVGLTGIITEITERKRADEARKRQEESFKAQIRKRINYYRRPEEG